MAFGNPAAERAAIETTYEDTATVSRVVPVTGSDKITKRIPQAIHTDIICGLSYSRDSSKQTRAQQNLEYDAVVFMDPDLSILPGDNVSVRRFGRDDPTSRIMLAFEVVGLPPVYATHQEVRVKAGDLA